MEFKDWYRSKIFSNEENPPDALWESLQDELDSDLVWKRLTISLDAKKTVPLWIYRNIAASAAILIALTTLMLFVGRNNSEFQNPAVTENREAEIIIDQPTEILPAETRIGEVHSVEILTQTTQKEVITSHTANIGVAQVLEAPTYLVLPDKMINMGGIIKMPDFGFTLAEAGQKVLSNPQVLPEIDQPAIAELSFGLLGQYANTWLLSPKTFTGLQSHELTATNATFGKNAGITASSMLTDKTGIRADFFLISQNRQNYFEYINGQYLQTGLELNYSSISVLMSRKFGRRNSQHSVNLGAYAGFLQQAEKRIGNSIEIITGQYSNTDFGIVAGYEYQWPISRNLFLGTGVFARYGLTNSFSGTTDIPDFLNQTHNAAFIFSFSINYSIFQR